MQTQLLMTAKLLQRIALGFSGTLAVISIVIVSMFGLKPGIDFTGGSLLEVRFLTERPAASEIVDSLSDIDISSLQVQHAGESEAIVRFSQTDEVSHQEVLSSLESQYGVEELRFDAIGPVIGSELTRKTMTAIGWSLAVIIIFIAIAFRKVSRPVASWKYGLVAIITLFHDVLIVTALFALLGQFGGVEVGIPFVAAILTVLGYSVNDTIVVFDRVRENIAKRKKKQAFANVVVKSVRQSIVRSVNTSATTLVVLAMIFLFGGTSTQMFILALGMGIAVGTYSSLFLASPLLLFLTKEKK